MRVAISVGNDTQQIRFYHPRADPDQGFTYQYTRPKEHILGPRPNEIMFWVSNSNFNKAEAACARWGNYSKCATRVVPVEGKAGAVDIETASMERTPNILLIMIDPISRSHFQRSMPKTLKALNNLGFIHFSNYTAVGPNSGKNQAALYSGLPLASRDGIKKDGGRWLWDRLRENGFITLKTENGK